MSSESCLKSDILLRRRSSREQHRKDHTKVIKAIDRKDFLSCLRVLEDKAIEKEVDFSGKRGLSFMRAINTYSTCLLHKKLNQCDTTVGYQKHHFKLEKNKIPKLVLLPIWSNLKIK